MYSELNVADPWRITFSITRFLDYVHRPVF
jgi:hypothetical protein